MNVSNLCTLGLPLVVVLGCDPSSSVSAPEKVGQVESAIAIGSTIWPNGNVPFCYYNGPTDDTCAALVSDGCNPNAPRSMLNSTDPGFAAALSQIRSYIDGSWGRVGKINFNNWPACPSGSLAGKVVLKIFPNFPGGVRNPPPDGRTEIRVGFADQGNVIHEFGHALGFVDEQTARTDFINCATLGPPNSTQPTPADPDSIMAAANYCQDNSWFDKWDISAIKAEYGLRPRWQVFGDYDGDGKADLVTWTPGTGVWHTRRQSPFDALNLPDRQWGIFPDIPVPGDYDGDGLTDLAIWRASNGGWYILSSRTLDQTAQTPGKNIVAHSWGIPGDIPVPGDYDGDGTFDLAIFRPGITATWAIAYGAGAGPLASTGYGTLGDIPVPGDYDGDGKYDLSVYRPSTRTWFTHYSGGGDHTEPNFGIVGDVTVQADYDGDGKTDMALWRPLDGTWRVIKSNGGGLTVKGFWGVVGDVGMAFDYTGDGRADPAIYRPFEGRWYIWDMMRTNATYPAIAVGSPNDVPVLMLP